MTSLDFQAEVTYDPIILLKYYIDRAIERKRKK